MSRLQLQRAARATYIDGEPVVRDVKFPCERTGSACKPLGGGGNLAFEDGKWHTILMYGQGTGGDFFFALDITNPVTPVYLWEFRDPKLSSGGDGLGLTVAPATIIELPSAAGATDKDHPGSAVFAPGGFFADGSATKSDLYTLRPFNGLALKKVVPSPADLGDDLTRPFGITNGMVGSPRGVDGDLDGTVDRIFFGDKEGRLWKACDIKDDGAFATEVWFDPARYDSTPPGQPVSSSDPTSGLIDAHGRQKLRGPIYFAPDVTRNQNGELIVVFGSGNLQDPLTPPNRYNNLVWAVKDDPSVNSTGPGIACSLPTGNACNVPTQSIMITYDTAAGTGGGDDDSDTASVGSSTATYTNVVPLNRLLSSAPFIFNKYLFYSEFNPDPDGNTCTNDEYSRVYNLNTFDCTDPGASAPLSSGVGMPYKQFNNTLVTGVEINPSAGTVFIQTSTPGNNPPTALQASGISVPPAYAGWKVKD